MCGREEGVGSNRLPQIRCCTSNPLALTHSLPESLRYARHTKYWCDGTSRTNTTKPMHSQNFLFCSEREFFTLFLLFTHPSLSLYFYLSLFLFGLYIKTFFSFLCAFFLSCGHTLARDFFSLARRLQGLAIMVSVCVCVCVTLPSCGLLPFQQQFEEGMSGHTHCSLSIM